MYTVFKTDNFLTHDHLVQIEITSVDAKVINPSNESSKIDNALIVFEQDVNAE